MDEVPEATLAAKQGLVGNADQGGLRQVTLLSQDRWNEVIVTLGRPVDPVCGGPISWCRGWISTTTGGRCFGWDSAG
jgi:hypothetical protein